MRSVVGTTREGADKEAETGIVERSAGRLRLTGFQLKLVNLLIKPVEGGERMQSHLWHSRLRLAALGVCSEERRHCKKEEKAFAFRCKSAAILNLGKQQRGAQDSTEHTGILHFTRNAAQ